MSPPPSCDIVEKGTLNYIERTYLLKSKSRSRKGVSLSIKVLGFLGIQTV